MVPASGVRSSWVALAAKLRSASDASRNLARRLLSVSASGPISVGRSPAGTADRSRAPRASGRVRYNSLLFALVRKSRLMTVASSDRSQSRRKAATRGIGCSARRLAAVEAQGTLASSAGYITTLSCALGSFRQPMKMAGSLPRFTATCGTLAGINR